MSCPVNAMLLELSQWCYFVLKRPYWPGAWLLLLTENLAQLQHCALSTSEPAQCECEP